jgi:hypothetical protein
MRSSYSYSQLLRVVAQMDPNHRHRPSSCTKLISAFSSTSASTFLGAALVFAGAFALGLGWALGGGALA